jgi:hypothetical protein
MAMPAVLVAALLIAAVVFLVTAAASSLGASFGKMARSPAIRAGR